MNTLVYTLPRPEGTRLTAPEAYKLAAQCAIPRLYPPMSKLFAALKRKFYTYRWLIAALTEFWPEIVEFLTTDPALHMSDRGALFMRSMGFVLALYARMPETKAKEVVQITEPTLVIPQPVIDTGKPETPPDAA